MKLKELTGPDHELVQEAKALISRRHFKDRTTVAAAIRSGTGKVFVGVNMQVEKSAPTSMCAEYPAIGALASAGEKRAACLAAVVYRGKNRFAVLPPCGKCRQLLQEFGNPDVIVPVRGKLKKVSLKDLVPFPV